MNYLAHVLLSSGTPERLAGALLGDFVKGPLDGRFPPAVRAAIALHRAIDRYTDRHPLVQEGRSLVSAGRRRFAGILVDVFFDHFLACHWKRYCDRPLERFTGEVYATLLARRHGFPERLQRMLPRMASEDWLAAYRDLWAVEAALNGIARRLSRFDRARVLGGAIEELTGHYAGFEGRFLAFFPQLQAFAANAPSGPAAGGCPELPRVSAVAGAR